MSSSPSRPEFVARYLVESPEPIARVAETIAGEQSSGTFLAIAGETAALKARSRARVVNIDPLPPSLTPGLASAHRSAIHSDGPYHRAHIEIAFPTANVGANLTALMATIAGNLFELGELTGIRLLDLDLPAEFATRFAGPQFGIAGTRRLAQVEDGPLIGTIIKPSIGLSAAETAALVDELCAGDIDFIKDDELTADPDFESFEARFNAVMPVIARHADRLGRKVMYAANISGTIDEMKRRHDLVAAAGGTCVMVSLNWVGIAGVQHLRSYSELPIHGHRNGWGMFTRHPSLGIDFAVYQKLWRLAGADHIHVNGIRNKFWEPDQTSIASARACLSPFAGIQPAMPVFSSGQWAGQAPDTFAALGSADLMHLAGGGIIGHPMGVAAGVTSMRQGWEAAMAGISLQDYAVDRPALRAALLKFGS
jgi:ribulose-bisphosphate carboxylase large chain